MSEVELKNFTGKVVSDHAMTARAGRCGIAPVTLNVSTREK